MDSRPPATRPKVEVYPSTPGFINPARLSAAIFSKYLMNDIPRGTTRAKLINSLLAPRLLDDHGDSVNFHTLQPDVICSISMSDSRLDDELSVAVIEFSDTPKWLRYLNADHYGFPKKTALGTLWRGVDLNAIDEAGQTEFIRAVSKGTLSLLNAEMLAEFNDTDVNIQDDEGRTALHWACALDLAVMVRLCLSVPECIVGLKDTNGMTAFDISRHDGNDEIADQFYRNILEIESFDPQRALRRVLTVTSEPAKGKPIFPGAAMFSPVEDCDYPLVEALIERGIDLTTRNEDGDTALHVAVKYGHGEIMTRLLKAGSDVNAIGNGGATPLHYAACDAAMAVEVLMAWGADITAKDNDGKSAVDWAAHNGQRDTVRVLLRWGADRGGTDESGWTVLKLAKDQQRQNLVVPKSVTDIPTSAASGAEGAIQRVGVGHSPEGTIESMDAEGSEVIRSVVMGTNPDNDEGEDNNQPTALHQPAKNGRLVADEVPLIRELNPNFISAIASRSSPRVSREFRIMCRPLGIFGDRGHKPKKASSSGKFSRMFRPASSTASIISDFSEFLSEKTGHWALVVLAPSEQPEWNTDNTGNLSRPPLTPDDPRIERVFEITNTGTATSDTDQHPSRPQTPEDSETDDRHEEDEGFFQPNKHDYKMQVSNKPRFGFVELRYDHLKGGCWEILTGPEARTKFTNSELRHEALRIWKRQQNYRLLDNNCQRFCILLAISIRVKNHALLRALQGEILRKQVEELDLATK